MCAGTRRGQEGASDTLEPELQACEPSRPVRALGTTPGPPEEQQVPFITEPSLRPVAYSFQFHNFLLFGPSIVM